MTDPQGGVADPQGGVADPQGGVADPQGGVADPQGGVADPQGGVADPQGGVADPQGGVADPQGGVADQEPARADTDRVGRVLRDGFQKIADSLNVALATVAVTNRVTREVGAQERQWGLKSWPEGTGPTVHPIAPLAKWVYANAPELAEVWKAEADMLEANQAVTWWDLLLEEVLEVAAEDPSLENQDLDTELIQVAAVCVSWLKDRDRRRKTALLAHEVAS